MGRGDRWRLRTIPPFISSICIGVRNCLAKRRGDHAKYAEGSSSWACFRMTSNDSVLSWNKFRMTACGSGCRPYFLLFLCAFAWNNLARHQPKRATARCKPPPFFFFALWFLWNRPHTTSRQADRVVQFLFHAKAQRYLRCMCLKGIIILILIYHWSLGQLPP